MKNRIILLGLTLTLLSCGSWNRIGDLTTIGNRNVDDSKKYSLLTREVEAIASADSDALEQAVDNLTKKYEGEFLRNVKVYVKSNGKKVKVIGDVWGTQNTTVNVTAEANAKIVLNVGDSVVFKRKGKLTDGKIIGINSNTIIVEYDGDKKTELKYDEVTKTNKV
jgi:ribosome maturation factor RimP